MAARGRQQQPPVARNNQQSDRLRGEREIESIAADARAAHASIRTLFVQNVLETREADKREFAFLSQLQSRPAFSWIAFGWPDGSFFAAHKLGDEQLEMTEIEMIDVVSRLIDRYRVLAGDIEFEARSFEPTTYVVTDQAWYRDGNKREVPRWFNVSMHPNGSQQAIAYAGPIDVYQQRQGVLAIVIESRGSAIPGAAFGRQVRHGFYSWSARHDNRGA